MDQTLITAIRTVGQLLLHHPTTEVEARNNKGYEVHPLTPGASCFCYVGAQRVVAKHLGLSWIKLSNKCDKVLGKGWFDGDDWDKAGKRQQRRLAQKLADFNG